MICRLCPRNCAALRTETQGAGLCRMPEGPVVARGRPAHVGGAAHLGQPGLWDHLLLRLLPGLRLLPEREDQPPDFGRPITLERLADICHELIAQGAHNLNFVNPTHYAHVVSKLLTEHPMPVPTVWNSGGYDRVETLRGLEGKIQIYLPDLKYLDAETAAKYSAAADYPQVAQAAIEEMVRQTGPCQYDEKGLLVRGTVIRHLILPGQVNGAKAVMDYVARAVPAPRGALLPHEPIHPLGGPDEYAGTGPPPAPGRDERRRRLYAQSGAGRLLPGAHLRQGGIYPAL